MENNPVVETASRERCDAIRCAASAPVEKLEDHHAEIGDVNAQTAIAGQPVGVTSGSLETAVKLKA